MKAAVLLVLAVCVALLRAQQNEFFPLDILQGPVSQVVSEGHNVVSFNCTVKGKNLDWVVNEEYASLPRNERLINLGVDFRKGRRNNGVLNGTITIPATADFNSTRLRCVALNGSTTTESSTAVMTIAGSPLSPHPQLHEISSTELEVSWDEPFTWDSFPILWYDITVYNTSEPPGSQPHAYNLTTRSKHMTINAEMTSCSVLRFEVSASNEIGMSMIGITSGGFPVVPKEFPSAPEVDVSFTFDGTPKVEISFTPPALCSFHRAHYLVNVYTESNDAVHMGKLQLIDNSDNVVEAEISTILQANSLYYAIIIYQTQSTRISANVSFSTAFQPTSSVTTDTDKNDSKTTDVTTDTDKHNSKPTDEPSDVSPTTTDGGKALSSGLEQQGNDSEGDSNLVAIISATVGGCVAIATLMLIIIIVFIVLLRRQLSRKSELEREQRNTMVQNPIYEGPIYEIISENKRLKPLVPKAKVHAQESVYLDSPTQSLPHDCTPSCDTNGVIVNAAVDGKQHTGHSTTAVKMDGACVSDEAVNNLNQQRLTTKDSSQNTLLNPATEDAYTIMSPVVPVASITCHTNYHAASSEETVSERYVMDVTAPYSSSLQRNVTLV